MRATNDCHQHCQNSHPRFVWLPRVVEVSSAHSVHMRFTVHMRFANSIRLPFGVFFQKSDYFPRRRIIVRSSFIEPASDAFVASSFALRFLSDCAPPSFGRRLFPPHALVKEVRFSQPKTPFIDRSGTTLSGCSRWIPCFAGYHHRNLENPCELLSFRPTPISRFCHRDPTFDDVSLCAVSRFELVRAP